MPPRNRGATRQRIIVGDVALFSALLAALDIPPAWRARLTTLFGEPEKIADTLARLEQRRFGFPGFAAHTEIIEALSAFLGERSVGHMDPGARSAALMVAAVCDAAEAG